MKRCASLVQLGSDDSNEEAPAALDEAAGDYARLGLRFDQARALLSLGRAQRRLRQWGAARRFLQEALSAFETLGSPGWAELVRAEVQRVGARRPRPIGELTPSERRVAELAASGRSNKQIAHALHVTVHTVEAHLISHWSSSFPFRLSFPWMIPLGAWGWRGRHTRPSRRWLVVG